VSDTSGSALAGQTGAVPRNFRAAMEGLTRAQKSSKGGPAYSRFVNRRIGRVLAALAYVGGRTPNQVTFVSACFTYTAIALIALVRPSWWSSLLVLLGLVLGYALDAADGQLARLRGGGSVAGEWLDHTVDALKIGVLHLAVAISWFRFESWSDEWLLVPLGFQAVATVQFFSILLMDQLRRAHRGSTKPLMQDEGSSSALYSLAVIPTDYGLLCIVLGTMFAADFFRAVYTFLFVCNLGFMTLALPKWYREVGRLATSRSATA
jgi:phosphatidylglycerophosphate synthase